LNRRHFAPKVFIEDDIADDEDPPGRKGSEQVR
jgi:hypothetical protein